MQKNEFRGRFFLKGVKLNAGLGKMQVSATFWTTIKRK
jgi:hypothetical protein